MKLVISVIFIVDFFIGLSILVFKHESKLLIFRLTLAFQKILPFRKETQEINNKLALSQYNEHLTLYGFIGLFEGIVGIWGIIDFVQSFIP